MKEMPFDQIADLDPEERDFIRDYAETFRSMAAKHKQCPSPQLLAALQADVLPEDLKQTLAHHLASCRMCAVLARDMAQMESSNPSADELTRIRRRIFNAIPGRRMSPRKTFFMQWAPAAAYASLVLVILGSAFFAWHSIRQSGEPYVASVQSVFRVEKATAHLPVALVWRGEASRSQAYAADLENALEPYQANSYAEAVKRLGPVTQHYPQGVEGWFYLGVSQLMLSQNLLAATSLQQADQLAAGQSTDTALVDEVAWYRIVAQVRIGHAQEASAELKKLCQTAGVYQARACTGLKELASQGRAGTPR